jgi:hypothetical protein
VNRATTCGNCRRKRGQPIENVSYFHAPSEVGPVRPGEVRRITGNRGTADREYSESYLKRLRSNFASAPGVQCHADGTAYG